MNIADVVIPDRVVRKAVNLGLTDGDDAFFLAKKELRRMVRNSAIFTHEKGNRRYRDYVLKVVAGQLADVDLVSRATDCTECGGSGFVPQFETCELCEGDGCDACDGAGGQQVKIRCDACG